MEDRLKRLIEGNSEANRTKWALEWQKKGKKVIGIMDSYTPEEVISAAGMLPWRITGTWQGNVSKAIVYRSESSCGYCNHVLESYLNSDFDFMDGIIATDLDQDLLRMWEVMESLGRIPYYYAMHVPYVDSELNYRFMEEEIGRLISSLEDFGGVKITKESLRSSIDVYNKMRSLLSRVYELRKREIPPLSGAELLGITTTARVMPKDEFNNELEALLPYLEKRETNLKNVH
ncbi:2-hydroxyacyl-CoA dehydratase, partial [Thermodesulfobacteriota bacterium]